MVYALMVSEIRLKSTALRIFFQIPPSLGFLIPSSLLLTWPAYHPIPLMNACGLRTIGSSLGRAMAQKMDAAALYYGMLIGLRLLVSDLF